MKNIFYTIALSLFIFSCKNETVVSNDTEKTIENHIVVLNNTQLKNIELNTTQVEKKVFRLH